jgi:peptide-methionine (R)-S-oxide reductase
MLAVDKFKYVLFSIWNYFKKKSDKKNTMTTWKDIIHTILNGQPEPDKRVEKTITEWKKILTAEQFRVTRNKGTEAPHSGAMCSSHEVGKYACICCETLLFDSSIKFESGTGWPSFTAPIKQNAIQYIKDDSYGMVRVEVTCNSCDAHLGHVFPDGPKPSGLRYCINSESMKIIKE